MPAKRVPLNLGRWRDAHSGAYWMDGRRVRSSDFSVVRID